MIKRGFRKKTILVVAMADSIHTARWLNQMSGQGWDIHLFPATSEEKPNQQLGVLKICRTLMGKWAHFFRISGITAIARIIDFVRVHFEARFPGYRVSKLTRTITQLRPAVIHSMEMQAAGYLVLEAKHRLSGEFPKWIVTNWGSDVYLFGRLREHRDRIREVLTECDYYSCECQRDLSLAKKFGFLGVAFDIFPNSGGFDLKKCEDLKVSKTSDRRIVMVKGYQGWSGRALVALRALERNAALLKEYKIVIYSPVAEVVIAAELLTDSTGIKTEIVPRNTPHDTILSLHGKARISIGIGISDAISTSLLEAIVMGSFPIQSSTACANEWIEDGVNGMIVPPEDPEVIESAIRTALTDDDLVNRAAEINGEIATTRLDRTTLRAKAVEMYRRALGETEA